MLFSYLSLFLPFGRWDNRTSVVIPGEDIFYLVAFLSSAVPTSTGADGLEYILTQNKRILDFCERADLRVKQYLPHYTRQEDWKAHFGPQWESFVQRKSAYDPLAILAPGQRIFQKAVPFLWTISPSSPQFSMVNLKKEPHRRRVRKP